MDFMSVRDASVLWKISERWVQKLCEEGRVPGTQRFGRSWMIPKSASRPEDMRKSIEQHPPARMEVKGHDV